MHHQQILHENQGQLKLAEYMPKHRDIWIRIAQRENLDEKAFDYATWAFAGTHQKHFSIHSSISLFVLDGSLRSPNDRQGDLTKAREFGWTIQVDTFDGYVQCFDRLKQLKVIP